MSDPLIVPLPESLEPFRHELEDFLRLMTRKLHVNRHKGTSPTNIRDLMEGLERENRELLISVNDAKQFETAVEAVDVANMAFLIAVRAWGLTRPDFTKETRNGDA